MNKIDLWNFRKRHNITCSELASKIGVHRSQVTRWENDQQKIPKWLERFLECLDELAKLKSS